MLKKIALLCLLSAPAFGYWERGLKVKFSSLTTLPENATAASAAGWVQVGNALHSEYNALERWCPTDDYTYCLLFDDNGYAAGIQAGFPADDFTPEYDLTKQGFLNWTVTINGTETTMITSTAYFMTTDYLAKDSEYRLDNYNTTKIVQDDVYVLSDADGSLKEVSIDPSKLEASNFTLQNYVIIMGTHYFYNMSASTVCSAEGLYPYFILVDSEQIIGFGFIAVGTLSNSKWENPGKVAVNYILKDAPDCLLELADAGKVNTLHFYLIAHPEYILNPLG